MVRRDVGIIITGSRRFQNITSHRGTVVRREKAGSHNLDSAGYRPAVLCADLNGVMTMTFVKTFLRDESGASAAEYALILAVVGAGIAFAAFALGEAVSTSIGAATSQVEQCSAGSSANCTP